MYIGSFWAQPLLVPDNRKLFEAEEQDLFLDIQSLPRNAALRKLNDLIKRARLAKVSRNDSNATFKSKLDVGMSSLKCADFDLQELHMHISNVSFFMFL